MKRRKNPTYIKVLLILSCIILFFALVGFLLWNRKEEAAESSQLQNLAEQQQKEEREERLSEEEAGVSHDRIYEEKSTETEMESEMDTESEKATDPEPQTETRKTSAVGISCWGDEFYESEAADLYSYRAVLEKILEDNGYEITVADKTLFGAGTLSMLKMAGVPQADIDTYIEKHKNQGNNGSVTETGVRDLTDEELKRWEKEYIPVLIMGYYGGWNNDIQELIEQEQKLLDTFGENKENFVIAGIPPLDKTVGTEAYDEAMEKAWGEHYISTSRITNYSQSTPEGQEEIAEAIFQKLVELNYISK